MKSLIFALLSFTFLILQGLPVAAQFKRSSARTANAKQVRFIEGIEIKREISPADPVIQSRPVITNSVPVSNSTIENSTSLQFKYGQLLNCNVESITNIPLFSFIDSWWEAPYQFGGSTKSGIDCSGFACNLFSTVFNKDLPRTAKEQYNVCIKTGREKLQEGDLVFFNTKGSVSHVGVYLEEGYFVHASTTNGVTINNLDDDYYSARFLGGGRVVVPDDAAKLTSK